MTSIAPERTTNRGASRWPCSKTISPGESDRVSALSASSSICAAVRRGNRIGSSGSRKPSTGVGEVYSLITAWGRRTRRRLGAASSRDAPGLTVGRRSRVNRPDGSARRPLHERADPCLCGGTQLLQRKGGRPHGAFVEVRLVAEAERRVPRVELLGALEEADDLAVLVGVGGHPVPGLRPEGRRAGLDDLMEPLGHGAILSLHLGDLRQQVALPFSLLLVRARFRLQLLGALPHRGPFLLREPLGLLRAHRSLPCGMFRVLIRPTTRVYSRLRALTSRFLIGPVSRSAATNHVTLRSLRELSTANFGELRHSEVQLLRIPLPRTRVNNGRGRQATLPQRRNAVTGPDPTA